jgi:signal transduction histidine kinase
MFFRAELSAFTLLVMVCSLLRCGKEKITGEPEQEQRTRIADSIVTLDSLAFLLVVRDNRLACGYASAAVSLSREISSDTLLVRSMNIKGFTYSSTRYDSAFWYYQSALSLADSIGYDAENASVLYNLSMLYYGANDFRNAIVLLDSSIHEGTRSSRASAVADSWIGLGNVYLITGEYGKAKSCYDSALVIAIRNGLWRETGVVYANLAKFQEDNDSAISYMRRAVGCLALRKGTEEELTNAEINLAIALDDLDSAIAMFERAIDRAIIYGMRIELMGAYNNVAYKYLKKGALAKAETCIRDRAIPLAVSMENYDWLSTLYDTYADILARKLEFREAFAFLRKSGEARLVYEQISADRQVRLLNAILEVNNKNLLISEKEKEIIKKDVRITRMYFYLAVAGFLILVAAGIIFWIRQSGKARLQQSKLDAARRIIGAEEHERERNAMELHDTTGMMIAKVHDAVRNLVTLAPSERKLLEKHFEEFSTGIRNMSHRMSKRILERHPFPSLIKGLCGDAVVHHHLNLSYRIDETTRELPADVTIHLVRIIQELFVNARKYARNAEINLTVTFREDRIEIVYSDNGPGFNREEAKDRGMGFSNIFARVNLLSGHAQLDAEPGFGVHWSITAPLRS